MPKVPPRTFSPRIQFVATFFMNFSYDSHMLNEGKIAVVTGGAGPAPHPALSNSSLVQFNHSNLI